MQRLEEGLGESGSYQSDNPTSDEEKNVMSCAVNQDLGLLFGQNFLSLV